MLLSNYFYTYDPEDHYLDNNNIAMTKCMDNIDAVIHISLRYMIHCIFYLIKFFVSIQEQTKVDAQMLFGAEMSGTALEKLYNVMKTTLEEIHNKGRVKLESKLIRLFEK